VKISKILITGCAGFVGGHLCRQLIELGVNVVGGSIEKDEIRIDVADINQLRSLDCRDVDAAIHLAAKTSVSSSAKYPYEAYYANILGTLNLLELCRSNSIKKFIFMSSYVYGQPKYLPVDEKHPVDPHSTYHKSKLIAEQICKNYSLDFGMDIVTLRPFLLYGPNAKSYMFISTAIQQIRHNGNVYLSGKETSRDFLFISDFLDLITNILNEFPRGYNLYNVGYGESHYLEEVVQILAQLLNRNITISYNNQIRPGDVTEMIADISKVSDAFHWKPKIGVREGLAKTLQKA
jgi:nucleoside-diphosphate-sugar epimerase